MSKPVRYIITGFKAVDSREGSQYERLFETPESARAFVDDRIEGFNLNHEQEWTFIRIEAVYEEVAA